MNRLLMTAAATALVAFAAQAQARDQIRVVGSSTVFPFSTAVAEQFGQKSGLKTPVVESTGTGGGIKLFCAGVGEDTPDITNASRQIKKSEVEACAKAGVTEITEVKIGFDGIVLANSKQHTPYALSEKEIWLALAKEVPVDGKLVANPNTTWNQINPALPAEKIEVLGPPPTSGTRDAFVELVMDKACAEFPEVEALDADAKKAACQTVREDGVYVDAGENDNLIVQKLERQPGGPGHLRLQLPRPEHRQAAGQHDPGRRADASRTSPTASTRSRARSTSTSRTPMSASCRASASTSRSSPATRRSARKATSPTRA